MNKIANRDGMAAQYSYIVYSAEDLLAIDLVGADAAVKAVGATIIQRKKVQVDTTWRWLRVPKDAEISVLRTVVEPDPPLFRWHIVPHPSDHDLSVVVYGWKAILPAANAFIGALGRWTVWPTLPEWGMTLYVLGRQHDLIKKVNSEGVDYAFAISTVGWDTVIDQAVKTGRLLVPA